MEMAAVNVQNANGRLKVLLAHVEILEELFADGPHTVAADPHLIQQEKTSPACVKCMPKPVPGLESLIRDSPIESILSRGEYIEMNREISDFINQDWLFKPTSLRCAFAKVLTTTRESTTLNDSPEWEQLLDAEREDLLRSGDESNHPVWDWKVDDTCVACLSAEYRLVYIRALTNNDINRTDIGDIMAMIAVFAPALRTGRMQGVFSENQLRVASVATKELPDIEVGDTSIMKAIRLYLNGKGDEVQVPMFAGNKKLLIMFES
ncbi:hypothetical protein BG004_002964, partial [Podila humilis]